MKPSIRSAIVGAALAAASWFGIGTAHAEMMLNKVVMASLPNTPHSDTLDIDQAGTLTITVSDLVWPKALESLTFALADASEVLGHRTITGFGKKSTDESIHEGEDSFVYDVHGPMKLFSNVYAFADGHVCAYRIKVDFVPAVPLPMSAWLLVSGLVGLGAFWRKHETVTHSVVQ